MGFASTILTDKVLFGAVAMGVFATSCAAQERQVVQVLGSAERMCTLGLPGLGNGVAMNIDAAGGSVFNVTQLTDDTLLTTQAARVTVDMSAMCNGVHRISLGSDNNGLWRQQTGSTQSGFGYAVPYQANLVWADQQYVLTADASTRGYVEDQLQVMRAAAGNISIEFEISAGATNQGQNKPLLAGDYSDVLRLTVQPQ